MVVEVAPVHEVEDEAELVLGVEGVGHADDEGTVVACADQAQHYPLVESQGLSLLHLYPFLVKTLHGVHLARVCLPAAVHLSEPPTSDNSVDREVVHAQVYIQLQILPLTEPGGVIYSTLIQCKDLQQDFIFYRYSF